MASTRSLAIILASGLLLAAVPAAAQFSDSYKILEIAGRDSYFGSSFVGSGATLFTAYHPPLEPSPSVFFFASQSWDTLHTADETGLYRTDGTREGTSFVGYFTDISEMAVANGKLLISGPRPGEGRELWSYDGTSLTMVKDIFPGTVASNPGRFFVVPAGVVSAGELLLFAADPDGGGPSLHVTDGTLAGTSIYDTLKDPREFVAFNGRVFLTAKVSQAATETNLWSWSPATGSQLVESRVDGSFAVVSTTLFFAMRSGSPTPGRVETEVWKTDGTPDAAIQVSDLWPGGDAAVSDLTAVGTTVFFAACDPAAGRGLYKTDGTTVTLVKDFLVPGGSVPPPANSCDPTNGPSQLAAINGKLYFVVDEGGHGLELWTSDGTTAGTVLVQDLNTGADPLLPEPLDAEPSDPSLNAASCGRSSCRAVTAGGFFFTAWTWETGRELWYFDGTSVTQVGDPAPGGESGVASDRLALVGDKLFFAGSDDEGNSEPWALPLSPTLSIADVAVSESAGPATLTVRLLPPNPSATVTVDWRTTIGSAGATDFTSGSGTLTFAAGVGSQPITIPIAGDAVGEGDETFEVVLENAVNAGIGNSPATVTIYDDEPARTLTIAFVPPTTTPTPPFTVLREGYSARFDVTLTGGAHAAPISVDYRTIAVTARSGSDFTPKTSFTPGVHTIVHTPLVFPITGSANPQTQTINVSTTDDQTFEAAWKEFRVELFNPPPGVSILTRSASAQIENDDVLGLDGAYWPTVSVGDKTVAEDDTFATFRATLDHPSELTTRIFWVSGVTGEDPPADPGLDYRNASGFFVFRAGQTTHDLTVEVFEDAIDEPNERYWVDMDRTTALGAIVGVGRGVGLITDDDAATLAMTNPAPVTEGDAGSTDVTFNMTLSTPYYRDFTIDYTTGDGTALAGPDYTAVQGTLLFPKGTTSRSIAVPMLGDVIDESNETFRLVLTNSTGPGPTGTASVMATATITDDDTTVSVLDASVNETDAGTATITFTVQTAATGGNKTAFTVDYTTLAGGAQPATPGADYVETFGTLSFPQSTRTRTFTVTVNSDLVDELAENFLVHLSNSTGPLILRGEAVGTINDNDNTAITINNVTLPEGNSGTTDAVFTVSLSRSYYRDFTVDWVTAAGTATEGVDYLAGGGILTFPAGTTSQTVAVPVAGDLLDEANETFEVVLSNSTGPSSISDSRGLGTITDDDALVIDAADVEVVEGNSGTTQATFTVTVSAEHTQTVTVRVATSAGGPTPPAATSGTDFTPLPITTLTFLAGVLSQQVSVTVIGDTVVEANNESFGLSLSSPTGGATLARTKALGVILDDDSTRTISLSPASVAVSEPLSGTVDASFTATLNVDAGRTVTVGFATANGTALAGSDYTPASGTVTFAPGDRTKSIDVTVLADSLVEGNETFTLTLSAPTNGTIAGSGTATATIADSISQIPMDFYTVEPCRLVDTRAPSPGSPLVAGVPRMFPVVGGCLIPATARAISFNVTVTGATSSGNVRLYPGGTEAPTASALNFAAGVTRANNGIVALGTAGDVAVLLAPTGTAHLIIDVNGYME